jgi:hypothetical protein
MLPADHGRLIAVIMVRGKASSAASATERVAA